MLLKPLAVRTLPTLGDRAFAYAAPIHDCGMYYHWNLGRSKVLQFLNGNLRCTFLRRHIMSSTCKIRILIFWPVSFLISLICNNIDRVF
jgi:hypothetical protein